MLPICAANSSDVIVSSNISWQVSLQGGPSFTISTRKSTVELVAFVSLPSARRRLESLLTVASQQQFTMESVGFCCSNDVQICSPQKSAVRFVPLRLATSAVYGPKSLTEYSAVGKLSLLLHSGVTVGIADGFNDGKDDGGLDGGLVSTTVLLGDRIAQSSRSKAHSAPKGLLLSPRRH